MKEDIINKIINYDNKNNLSWTSVYKEVLKDLKLDKEINNHELLHSIVKELTTLGYDITPIPFKLDKYK